MVAVAQDKKQDNQENNPANDFTQKMRNRCLPFRFEIKIPNVAIDQSDDQRRA